MAIKKPRWMDRAIWASSLVQGGRPRHASLVQDERCSDPNSSFRGEVEARFRTVVVLDGEVEFAAGSGFRRAGRRRSSAKMMRGISGPRPRCRPFGRSSGSWPCRWLRARRGFLAVSRAGQARTPASCRSGRRRTRGTSCATDGSRHRRRARGRDLIRGLQFARVVKSSPHFVELAGQQASENSVHVA